MSNACPNQACLHWRLLVPAVFFASSDLTAGDNVVCMSVSSSIRRVIKIVWAIIFSNDCQFSCFVCKTSPERPAYEARKTKWIGSICASETLSCLTFEVLTLLVVAQPDLQQGPDKSQVRALWDHRGRGPQRSWCQPIEDDNMCEASRYSPLTSWLSSVFVSPISVN